MIKKIVMTICFLFCFSTWAYSESVPVPKKNNPLTDALLNKMQPNAVKPYDHDLNMLYGGEDIYNANSFSV